MDAGAVRRPRRIAVALTVVAVVLFVLADYWSAVAVVSVGGAAALFVLADLRRAPLTATSVARVDRLNRPA